MKHIKKEKKNFDAIFQFFFKDKFPKFYCNFNFCKFIFVLIESKLLISKPVISIFLNFVTLWNLSFYKPFSAKILL